MEVVAISSYYHRKNIKDKKITILLSNPEIKYKLQMECLIEKVTMSEKIESLINKWLKEKMENLNV